MALNPIAYAEKVVWSFLKYQLTAYPFSNPRLGLPDEDDRQGKAKNRG